MTSTEPTTSGLFRDPDVVNPDCAARDRIHPPHQLASPDGNKPGAHCAGVPDADGNLRLGDDPS